MKINKMLKTIQDIGLRMSKKSKFLFVFSLLLHFLCVSFLKLIIN